MKLITGRNLGERKTDEGKGEKEKYGEEGVCWREEDWVWERESQMAKQKRNQDRGWGKTEMHRNSDTTNTAMVEV